MVEESDEDEGHTASPNQVESQPPAMNPAPAPTGAAAEENVQEENESSSTSGNDGEGNPLGDALEKVAVSTSSVSSCSSSDSSGYLVGRANPVEVAEALLSKQSRLSSLLARIKSI